MAASKSQLLPEIVGRQLVGLVGELVCVVKLIDSWELDDLGGPKLSISCAQLASYSCCSL